MPRDHQIDAVLLKQRRPKLIDEFFLRLRLLVAVDDQLHGLQVVAQLRSSLRFGTLYRA